MRDKVSLVSVSWRAPSDGFLRGFLQKGSSASCFKKGSLVGSLKRVPMKGLL